jgi:tetratricopeptide (TPR) repeat protein
MTARGINGKKTSFVATLSLLFFLAMTVFVGRGLDRLRPQNSSQDVLYVDSPKILKRASLGYDGLMACIYWTRAVQYFGHRHHDHEQTFNELAPLLEITTHLDPHLVPAYDFGANFLAPAPPNGAGQPERAIQLIEYGIQNNPDDWRLYYNLGFIYYMDLKDYAHAAQAFERGALLPNAHPFLKGMAARMAQHAGEFSTARMLWMTTYESTSDEHIKRNALDHLRALKVDEDVTHLQEAVTRFGEQTGKLPATMAELVGFLDLRGVPVDPDGVPYRLDRDGRVLVADPESFPYITRGLPPGHRPAPPSMRAHQ